MFNQSELKRGTHVHCMLYGGMDAYVLSITPESEPLQRAIGNIGCRGGAKINLVYEARGSYGEAFSTISEGIVRGVQWTIGTKPDMSEDALRALETKATENLEKQRANYEKARLLKNTQENAGKEILALITSSSSKAVGGFSILTYQQDRSDLQSDYHAASTEQTWVIGISSHKRNNFNEMRKHAQVATQLVHNDAIKGGLTSLSNVNPEFEHRENYSGGNGMYLKEKSYGSGWSIEKWSNEPFYHSKISQELGQGHLIIEDKNDFFKHKIPSILSEYGLTDSITAFMTINGFEINSRLQATIERMSLVQHLDNAAPADDEGLRL